MESGSTTSLSPHLWTNSWTRPTPTLSVSGGFKKPERYIYVAAQKWQADGPLLIYHGSEALTAVSPSPVSRDEEEIWAHCRSCSLTAPWCKFPTYEWVGPFGTGRYGCWYWQVGIYGAMGIGPNGRQRQERREEEEQEALDGSVWWYRTDTATRNQEQKKNLELRNTRRKCSDCSHLVLQHECYVDIFFAFNFNL